MSNLRESFFALIRNEIRNEPLPSDLQFDAGKLLSVAKRHDLAHLIADGLIRGGKISQDDGLFNAVKKARSFAIKRDAERAYFGNLIGESFAKNEISYIPLKGSVICELYPEPWMRTTSDLDILVREEDIDKATETLKGLGFTTDGKRHYHDIAFDYGDKFKVELHFSVCEQLTKADGILKNAWDYAEKVTEYEYRESAEFFLLHHIAHMAYHFLTGGCGIRPFIDLFVMQDKGFYSEEKLLPLLEKADLTTFYRSATKLSAVWLNGEEGDEATEKMEGYVVTGGAFGNKNSALASETVTNKGKNRLLLAKAFPPYAVMCDVYPSLIKRRWLLPIFYIRRGFAKAFGKDRKKTKEIISRTMAQPKTANTELATLLKNLGLDDKR